MTLKSPVIIWDLDGTLIDSSKRPTIKDALENGIGITKEVWEKSDIEQVYDGLLPLVHIYEFFKGKVPQVVLTARQMLPHDLNWLEYHELSFNKIYGNELNDWESNIVDYKQCKLQEIKRDFKADGYYLFEDNYNVIKELQGLTGIFDAVLLNKINIKELVNIFSTKCNL